MSSNVVSSGSFLIDTQPDSFSWADQTAVAVSTLRTCVTEVTVAGLGVTGVAVVLTGPGEYRKNTGSWVTSAGVADNGDTFEVRHTSSAASSSSVNTTLSIGGVADTFTSTTAASAGDPYITAPGNIVRGAGFYYLLGGTSAPPKGMGM